MNRNIILLLCLIFVLSFVNSAPPILTNVNTGEGLEIYYPTFQVVTQNEGFQLHLHVTNISNGVELPADSYDCYVHLYDLMGNHTYESENLPDDSNGLEKNQYIDAGNFSTLGTHGYYIHCNSTDSLGGSVKGLFEVKRAGEELTLPIIYSYFGSIGFMFFMMFFLAYISWHVPSDDNRNDDGEIININWLKHLRPMLWMINYGLFLAQVFILQNFLFGYINHPMLTNFFFAVYQILFWVMIIVLPIYVMWLFYKLYRDGVKAQLIERGVGLDTL